jgi:GDP-L-fucose synthase
MDKSSRIFLAGHRGTVGSAIYRNLKAKGYTNILVRSSAELDLRNQSDINDFFKKEQPEYVIDSAARVGGILANNNYPYQFISDNLMIQQNLMDASLKFGVEKFIFLGSSCVYPKHAPMPIKEEYLLTSSLEPTNEWYAIAKIAGVKTCQAIRRQYGKQFITLMPTNTYGREDNFDLLTSHVLPAMIRKFHDAKVNNNETVVLWGTGTPMREFIFVDDLADGIVFAFENNLQEDIYNIGTGKDLIIKDLAQLIQHVVGHKGEIFWDSSKPDGTPRKLMDVSRLANEGWKAKVELEEGIKITYDWFLENQFNYKTVVM